MCYMEEMHRARCGGGEEHGASVPSPGLSPEQHLDMFTNQEAFLISLFKNFYRAQFSAFLLPFLEVGECG